MRKYLILAVCSVAVACVEKGATTPDFSVANRSADALSGGFDQYGYNRQARIFNGAADGIDRNLDGKIWGSTAYASDHLVMKWNSEWDRGNREGWSKPPYDAWLNNEWSGASSGGSGSVWHYKYKWVGPCGAAYTPLPSGGYCLWGQFEVLQDHGIDPSFDSGHMWFARSVPGGYGN